MGMPSKQSLIWRVFLACAGNQKDTKCRFESEECTCCKYYAYNYINADPRDVKLLMFQAKNDINSLDSSLLGARIFIAVVTAIIITIIVGGVWLIHIRNKTLFSTPTASAPAIVQKQPTYERYIRDTLYKVDTELNARKDINNDGKINCIDAAVIFYKYYPNKDDVRIYCNMNDSTNMNHLFNLVYTGTDWIGVEPQAKHAGWNEGVYRMSAIWGKKYDYRLNKDETNLWIKYVK